MNYKLFDDRALDAHIRALSLDKSPPLKRQTPKKELKSMFTGVVKMFSERGFGFITRDDGSGDVFVHISAVTAAGLRALNPGDRVAFDLAAGRAGKTQAQDIRLLDAEAA